MSIKKILIGIIVLFLISFGVNIRYWRQKNDLLTVVKVLDGDTFTLTDGQRVRLLGVNAAEKGRCGYEEAKNLLTSLVNGKTIHITEEKRDYYGRRMGLVYVGKTLVNEMMLREGWARPDYTKNSQSERLRLAFRDSSQNNRGIHKLCEIVNPTPPSPNCTIKGNIDQGTWEHFYHLPNCRHYNQIVLNMDLGEQFFCTEAQASAAGFRLAPDCLR